VRIQCVNSECLHPDSALGQAVCDRCQTPLVYRYLWAMGGVAHGSSSMAVNAADIPIDTLVADRYWVARPQIWLDTQPARAADVPTLMPNMALSYLYLYSHRLHLPVLYGFCAETEEDKAIALLDNAPFDATGHLLPTLETVWETTPYVRQIYWLWQILQLWRPLKQQGVATSLLVPENLHVEGWRVRLRELLPDRLESNHSGADRPESDHSESDSESSIATKTSEGEPTAAPEAAALETNLSAPSFKDLGALWQTWLTKIQGADLQQGSLQRDSLQLICQQMQIAKATDFEAIAARLDSLLLEQAAQLPLHLDIAGATTTGPQRTHNEDACFPIASPADETLAPHVGIICDGIGGHEGGEVASNLALRSLQIQTRVLLAELAGQSQPLTPAVVKQQLTKAVRVVNNLIASQNDTQKRELRQRMGTTLVMALQLPQQIPLEKSEPPQLDVGRGNGHELYLVHVGDSRAYWITLDYLHQLTLDDDVATREVLMGRSPYQEALHRADGGALTQALGTRNADLVEVNVQRFIIEEDGLLLLCSDGLSDCDRVEQFWQPIAQAVLGGKISLREAVQRWIDIANEKNGHDNTSVVLLRCLVSRSPQTDAGIGAGIGAGISAGTGAEATPDAPQPIALPDIDSDLADSSRALLYDDEPSIAQPTATPASWKPLSLGIRLLGLVVLAVIAGILGVAIWQQMERSPTSGSSAPSLSPSLPQPSSPSH
jgi:protein phosphatase